MKPIRQTLKQAGYSYIGFNRARKLHMLRNEDGKCELWFANKNHASYGLIWRNTHLEFASSYSL